MSKVKCQNIFSGQSVIEIIIAVAMFVIIAGSAVVTILGSFLTSRLAEEETQATVYAVEGIEAVQSIRNQGWIDFLLATDCSAGCGLDSVGGWSFSGTSDNPDALNKFTRVVSINDVERVNGDIVESGGTVDDDTKKVASSVTWDFTPSRTNTVELTTYVTNWQEGVKPGEAGTPTPTPTPTDTPVPTPTPAAASCSDYCIGTDYSGGTCRKKTNDCASSGEDYQSGGDQYCPGGIQKYCCCLP